MNMAVSRLTKEKKKKIKVKEEEEEENTDAVKCRDVFVQTAIKQEPLDVNDGAEKKKKKKKKMKLNEELDANNPPVESWDASVQTTVKTEQIDTNNSDAPEKTKKKKKKINEEEQIQEEDHLVSEKKKVKKDEALEGTKKKKRKTKKETEVEEEEEEEEEADLGPSVDMVNKKKKKEKRKLEEGVEKRELNTEVEDGVIKKKKRKKEADECVEVEQKLKKKKKRKSVEVEEPENISSNEKPEKKKSKKKKLEGESLPHANGENSSDKKKKKKKGKTEADVDVEEKPERPDDTIKSVENDKNKNLKAGPQEYFRKTASRVNDVVFLSAKPGNQDEISIDQARRLALQKEIDKESQPKPAFGQWGTASFDSSDRQAKFLRLMGGFKKSTQTGVESAGRLNMAMGKEGQQTLQQGLLGEFERAQNRHMDFRNKGTGLGFSASSNKKFEIDANARNSMRFDD